MTKLGMHREEAALRELGATRADCRVRWVLIIGYLLTIFTIPILQTWKDYEDSKAGRTAALRSFATAFSHATTVGKGSISAGFFPAITCADHSLKVDLHGFEKSLEKDSILSHHLLPRFQWLATKYLNLGNEKVILGHDDWLYYRPDVDYLIAGAFSLNSTGSSGDNSESKGSPMAALKSFRNDLSKRGISLLLLPVPVKPMIDPEHLSIDRRKVQKKLQTASYTFFVEKLNFEGIEVLDLTEILLNRKISTGKPQYLERDTHWTPDAMEAVADSLASKVRGLSPADFPNQSSPKREFVAVHQPGDLTGMLDLPPSQKLFAEQEVIIRPFHNPDGGHWNPDPNSPVLLLGDSFTRVFSAEDLNWGRDAGLAERLSEKLGKNIDVLAINAGGSSSVRQSLARSANRLDGKKIVLYEFSMRDLSEGDWKVIRIPDADSDSVKPEHSEDGITVTGVIEEISEIPPPGSNPYKDFVRSLHLKEVEGATARDILVFVHAIRKGRSTGAQSLQSGKRVTLHLIAWNKVESQCGSLNRSELQGAAADLPDLYWCADY